MVALDMEWHQAAFRYYEEGAAENHHQQRKEHRRPGRLIARAGHGPDD